MAQQLDKQILECVQGEALCERQQSELLAWVHSHLLSPYVALRMEMYPGLATKPAPKRFVPPCCTMVEAISQMLQGGIPLGEDLTFACPPSGCPRALALSRELPAWLRRRVLLAAQRTRLHSDAELTALWQAIEAHLVTEAVAWFELADWLAVDVPADQTLLATNHCLDVARGQRGVTWTPAGAVLQASWETN